MERIVRYYLEQLWNKGVNNYTLEVLQTKRRKRGMVIARQAVLYLLCRDYWNPGKFTSTFTLNEIGAVFFFKHDMVIRCRDEVLRFKTHGTIEERRIFDLINSIPKPDFNQLPIDLQFNVAI